MKALRLLLALLLALPAWAMARCPCCAAGRPAGMMISVCARPQARANCRDCAAQPAQSGLRAEAPAIPLAAVSQKIAAIFNLTESARLQTSRPAYPSPPPPGLSVLRV